MGRISVNVRIRNLLEQGYTLTCDALVDTGAAYMVLPRAWKERLGTRQDDDEERGEARIALSHERVPTSSTRLW